MMVILDNFMSHFLICFKHILRLNAGPFAFPSRPTPVIFEITFSISSRHMNHIWSNGNLAWIKLWLYVEKEIWIAIVSQGFKIMEAMGSPLSHQQLLTSIPSSLPTSSNGFFIEIHENITKVAFFIEDDIWALEHEDVCTFQSFFTATALEILREMLRQYPRFIQTYETFVHLNQSLCTSWCFIKSEKMQITWSWMNIETRRES